MEKVKPSLRGNPYEMLVQRELARNINRWSAELEHFGRDVKLVTFLRGYLVAFAVNHLFDGAPKPKQENPDA